MRKSRFGGEPPSILAMKSESGVVQSSLKRRTWLLSVKYSMSPSKVGSMGLGYLNNPGKHKRMNMWMEVDHAAVGKHTEDPTTHTGTNLQAFTKVFLPGLPCVAQQ